ncbi:polyamine ABC transporter substrate-binding protein [Azorhizobium oxalatiphilum]|uniref:Polyamine ABC transporter substrate-binding protein n=1 Tax=Azorhizobium oxalatiphilum TaxID=980631 RepID=A0A917BMF3_9HYPH|nr:extracellular solute-binding protein [Azorhizobium oxalatiphilum]GGF50526.1 polyamine ABC transporter substrate-binding protein [Azorhizobium oxalatiphilum]
MAKHSRRQVLVLGAAGAAGLAMPWVSRAHAQERRITVAAYSGIFEDIYKKTVIEPFMKANPSIRVNYVGFPTSAQNLGTLRAQKAAPQLDVCILDMVVAKAGANENLYKAVTPDVLPVMKQLVPTALIEGMPGPAVTFDNVAMIYSPKKFASAPTSWKELWNKAHAGRITLDAPPNAVGMGFTFVANKLAGGTDYRDYSKGIKLLGEMAPLVQSWEPKPDCYASVTSGNADLSVGYNARIQTFSRQTPDRIAASIPDEGSVFQINTINLVNNAPQQDAALEFMAYALSAQTQATFTEALPYAPTNRDAPLSPEALARTAVTPERMSKMINIDWLEVAKFRDAITEQWRRNVLTRS